MAELSQAFVAMPGGIGTLEELFEIFTWSQLALIRKPVAVLNTNGFYEELLGFINKMVGEGFLKPETASTLIVAKDEANLLKQLRAYRYAETSKWIERT